MMQQKDLQYKRICSLRLILGEKKSLKLLLEMIDTALHLLSFPTKEQAKAYYAALPTKPVYAPYIEEELFTVVWE